MPATTTVAYIHYQKFERDGSHTHTSNFIREFGAIAQRDGFSFVVRSPELVSGVPGEASKLGKLKSHIARFYVSDIKNLLKQIKLFFSDVRYLKHTNKQPSSDALAICSSKLKHYSQLLKQKNSYGFHASNHRRESGFSTIEW